MTKNITFEPSMIRPLTNEERQDYKDNGFLIYKADAVRAFREDIICSIKTLTLDILRRMGFDEITLSSLADKSFDNIVAWCYENETDNNITRTLYEMYPTMPEVIGCINHPLLLWLAGSIGIEKPVAVTIPTIRVDRPHTEKFMTLSHQDYWYSLVSDNSVVIWYALTSITEAMGYLKAIPGSHKDGLVPFEEKPGGYTYKLRDERPEEAYQNVNLAEDEILIFNQFFIHKSGKNTGHMPRFTMQVRYNDLNTMTDMVQTFTATSSDFILKRQQELLSNFATQKQPAPKKGKP